MDAGQFQRVEALFELASEQPTDNWTAFVESNCDGDSAVRDKVLGMLNAERNERIAFTRGEQSSTDEWFPIPRQFGRYTIIRLLGRGGMGEVYLAEQDRPHRTVALKVIRPDLATAKIQRRLEWEAEVLGRLIHPGIAQVYDAGVVQLSGRPQPFIAMEYVEGQELCAFAAARNLDTRGKLELLANVCDAVHHAHQKGVVHRDLKPSNILIANAGQPKILDFGIALATDAESRLTTMQTNAAQLIGTLAYMSPEQVSGRDHDVDTRSDIYALGVVTYELLSGRLPHDLRGRQMLEAARIVREEYVTRLGSLSTAYRGDLDIIVQKALEKDPERRYQSAAALAADLRHFLRSEPIAARPPTALYQMQRFVRRHRALVASTTIAFLALAIGMVLAIRFGVVAQARADEAQWANYRAQMSRAVSSLRLGDVATARNAIDSATERFRNWEWRYLANRLSPAIVERKAAAGRAWCSPHWLDEQGPLAVECGGTTLRVINAMTGRVVAEKSIDRDLQQALMSDDGSRVAAVEPVAGELHVWDIVGQGHWVLPVKPDHPEKGTLAFNFNYCIDAAGKRMAYLGTNSEKKWFTAVVDVETGRELLRFPRGWGGSSPCAFDRAGRRLAFASSSLKIFDVDSGAMRESVRFTAIPGFVIWRGDETLLGVASERHRDVHVLRADTLEQIFTIPKLRSRAYGLAFDPAGRTLALCRDQTTELWDIDSKATIGAFWGPAYRAAFDPTGEMLMTTHGEDLRIVRCKAACQSVFADENYLYLAAFSPDGSLVATGGFSGNIRLWDTSDGSPVGLLKTRTRTINGLTFSPDGATLLTASRVYKDIDLKPEGLPTDAIQTWDVTTSTAIREESQGPWMDRIRPGGSAVVAFQGVGWYRSADGTRCIHGRVWQTGNEYATELTDTRSGKVLLRIAGESTGVSINHDNRIVATSVRSDTSLWNAESGQKIRTLAISGDEEIYSLAFSNDDTRLVGTGRSGALYFWDVQTGERVCTFEDHTNYVHHVAFSDDGTRLVTASGDGTARLYDSVSNARRERELQATHDRRDSLRSSIRRWQSAGESREAIAARLRADQSLSAADRRVLFDELSGAPESSRPATHE